MECVTERGRIGTEFAKVWENEACIAIFLKIGQFEHCKRCELDGILVRNNENRDRLCR